MSLLRAPLAWVVYRMGARDRARGVRRNLSVHVGPRYGMVYDRGFDEG